jgi:SAM-dependent methyltransferase
VRTIGVDSNYRNIAKVRGSAHPFTRLEGGEVDVSCLNIGLGGCMEFSYTGTDLLSSNERALLSYNRWIVEQFVGVFAQNAYSTVVDFGAGIGTLCGLFRDISHVSPIALEIDQAQRDVVAQRGFRTASSIAELPAQVDLIYASNVLEHIPDDVNVLRDLGEHLSPTGRIAIFVPAFKLLWTSMDDKVGHQRRYTKSMPTDHLAQAGYEVESIRYADSVGFFLTLLFKLVGSKSGEPSGASLRIFDRFLWPISRLLDLIAHPFLGKNVLAIAKKR